MSITSDDNLSIGLRVRPLTRKEQHPSRQESLCTDKETNSVTLLSQGTTYTYDFVADQHTTQEELFRKVGQPLLEACSKGRNGSVIAYGQTGSGKTYTIMGDDLDNSSKGLLPRCCDYLFKQQEVRGITVTFLEIYQEQIYDLFSSTKEALQIREDNREGAYVEGLTRIRAESLGNAYEIMLRGCQRRHTDEHNEYSRSHSVFTLTVEMAEASPKLHFVDLAKSERQTVDTQLGVRLKEPGQINKSLSALGIVINALAEGKARHVSYRDSKLTLLLKDAFVGNGKTFIITNINPDPSSIEETMFALNFAARAKPCLLYTSDAADE